MSRRLDGGSHRRRLDGAGKSAGAGFAGAESGGGAEGPAPPAPERGIWEVFRQERKGQAFQHAGSLAAPDLTFAEEYAREFYGRRAESQALWVVPREAIHEVEDFVDELERNYHRVDGYSLKEKLKEARARAAALSAESPPRLRDELSAGE